MLIICLSLIGGQTNILINKKLHKKKRPSWEMVFSKLKIVWRECEEGETTYSTNVVEHPELMAQRLVRYANIVGRENVIGGSDCGFSSFASTESEIHPTVIWAKFKSMAEGARLASVELWGG